MQYQYRITLPPATGEAIERIAAISGVSPPKILRQWLTEAEEAFVAVAYALEKVSELEGQARQDFAAGFKDSAEHVNMLECELREMMGLMSARAARAAEGGTAGVGRAGRPPSSNTGATVTKLSNENSKRGV